MANYLQFYHLLNLVSTFLITLECLLMCDVMFKATVYLKCTVYNFNVFQAWQIDSTKPHFTLHYVVDYDESDSVEIKKDTSQQDEIQAMKRAWEAAEPGRAFKVIHMNQLMS